MLLLALLLALISLSSFPAQAANTYYISPLGRDSSCLAARSPSTPAGPKLKFVLGCMATSDILIGREGVYDEPLHKVGLNGFFPNGTPFASTIFKAFPGENVWLRTTVNDPWGAIFEMDNGASYITFDGIKFDGWVDVAARGFSHEYVPIKLGSGSHHIKITNFEVKNLPDGWFSSNTGNDNEVSNFKMYDYFPASSYLSGGSACGQITCWGYPFYWNGQRNKILNGELSNIPSYGVHLYCSGLAFCKYPTETLVQGLKITNYGFRDLNRGAGILVYQGNLNKVFTNYVWGGAPWVTPIVIGDAATNTVLKDNVFGPPPVITPPPPVKPPTGATVAVDIKTTGAPTVTVTVDGVKR